MSSLLELMPSLHQQESLQALFGLFLAPVGVYRWLVLVLIAFVLALCGLLMQQTAEEVDWAVAAHTIVRLLIPQIVIYSLLEALEPWRQEALKLGIELPKMG